MTAGEAATEPEGEPLLGDGVTPGIIRIGDTVRRPVRPFTATIQAFLRHLHDSGFDAAPVPLGVDEQGREVLSYVPGDVPRDPLPAFSTTAGSLVALARLIRRLHDAAAGWQPPTDAVFGSVPGGRPPGLGTVFDEPELVSHMDYCPGNVVFRDGLPVAFIDFDLSKPTTRALDCVNALYWWGQLTDPVDRTPALRDADVATRAAAFADAYGMADVDRRRIVPISRLRAELSQVSMRAAADADEVFRRYWEVDRVGDKLVRTVAWLDREGDRVTAALLS